MTALQVANTAHLAVLQAAKSPIQRIEVARHAVQQAHAVAENIARSVNGNSDVE